MPPIHQEGHVSELAWGLMMEFLANHRRLSSSKASSYRYSGHWTAFVTTAVILSVLAGLCGCVATKYKLAKKDAPAVQLLGIAFHPQRRPATLASLITYGGPGSWKREALWDEYVVELVNHGVSPLTIDSATLFDSMATPYAAGSDPWVIEKQSKKLEKQYRDHGEAFIRAAGPGVLIVGVGAAAMSTAAAGGGIYVLPAIAGMAVVTVVVLPVYYVSVLGINHHNKKAVMTEFKRRRLPLPLTLAPGESRTGSLFFPMVRSPASLALQWSGEPNGASTVLPLDFLKALHVPAAPDEHTNK